MVRGDEHISLFTVVQQHEEWGSQILRLQEQVAKLEEEQRISQQYSRLNKMEMCEERNKAEDANGSKQLTKPPPQILTESEQVVLQDSQTSAFIGEVGSQEAQGYHLAADSASSPSGYRFHMPRGELDLNDVQQHLWGEGSFDN